MYVTGKNNHGQLGLKHSQNTKKLIRYNISNHMMNDVYCGYQYTFFLDRINSCWAAGFNSFNNRCAIAYFKQKHIKIGKIFTNPSSHCTFWLSKTNSLYANGRNKQYQFGMNSHKNKSNPIWIPGFTSIIDIQSGQYHSLLLLSNGGVYSTDYNKYSNYWGQNGHASKTYGNDYGLKKIKALQNHNIKEIQCGYRHSLFLSCHGLVWCCGDNEYGQLGLGHTKTDKTMSPKQIHFVHNKNKNPSVHIKQISCGQYHNLAIDENKRIWSWGGNEYGQCGDGFLRMNIYSPKLIDALDRYKIIKIKCGSIHSYAKAELFSIKHFLFGSNAYNECTLNKPMEISVPFCINDVFDNMDNVKWIKDVYLGDQNTFIATLSQIEYYEYITFGFIRRIQKRLPYKSYVFYTIPDSMYLLCLRFSKVPDHGF